MVEIRPATRRDLPRVRELLRDANDMPYDLARVAEEKCFEAGVAGLPQCILATADDRLLGVAVTCGHWLRLLAVSREHRRKGVGSILLREAERIIGGNQIIVAAEAGNYFVPGIPSESEALRRFFHLNGYGATKGEAVDLKVDLSRVEAPRDDRIGRATEQEQEEVVAFVRQEFAPAWGLEVSRAFEHDEPTVFIARHEGRIAGFSAHDANNRGLGFFGPEGVLPELRGQGIGRLLLLSSLADLRRRGFTSTIIAWAAAHDFYRSVCGAEIAHRFTHLRKLP